MPGEAGNTITIGLPQALAGGGLSQILRMFGQGGAGGGGLGSPAGAARVEN